MMDNSNGAAVTPFNLEPAFLPVRRNSEPAFPRTSSASTFAPISARLLRRLDTGVDMAPRHQKVALLTLKLSSDSFLDCNLYDDHVRDPVYVTKTVDALTTIRRSDPWEGPVQTADIQWPKILPIKAKTKDLDSVLVQMGGGRWREAGEILKPVNLSNSHKFYIPSFAHSLKWKRSGAYYHCTCATVKGPIATYELATSSSPPRLKVYETLHHKYDQHKIATHNGVSTHLLDHLVTTLVLITTDIQGWLLNSNSNDPRPPSSLPTSALQWRKIIYGEPLYPKSTTPAATADNSPADPAPAGQWAKILHGEPLSSLRSPSPSPSEPASCTSWSTWDPRQLGETSFASPTTSLAPSHACTDSYYDANAPPVPEIPLQFRSTSSLSNSSGPSPMTPSPLTPSPLTPSPLSSNIVTALTHSSGPVHVHPERQQSWPRSQSTPPPLSTESGTPPMPQTQTPPSQSLDSRSNSVTGRSRRLPKPPQASPVTIPREKRASQYATRSLPPTPSSGPSSSVPGVSVHDRRQAHLDKEVDELTNWVRTLTREQRQRISAREVFDVPPPAYNDIFSHSNGPPPSLTD